MNPKHTRLSKEIGAQQEDHLASMHFGLVDHTVRKITSSMARGAVLIKAAQLVGYHATWIEFESLVVVGVRSN